MWGKGSCLIFKCGEHPQAQKKTLPFLGTDIVYHGPACAEALGGPKAMADLPRGLHFPLPQRLARDRFAAHTAEAWTAPK